MTAVLTLSARAVNLSSKLESLRVRHASIDAVVYVDFSAATVLGASLSAGRPQEMQDGLCRLAANVFGSPQDPDQAVLMTLGEVLVLQHQPKEPGTALCFFFPPETPFGTAREIARAACASLDP